MNSDGPGHVARLTVTQPCPQWMPGCSLVTAAGGKSSPRKAAWDEDVDRGWGRGRGGVQRESGEGINRQEVILTHQELNSILHIQSCFIFTGFVRSVEFYPFYRKRQKPWETKQVGQDPTAADEPWLQSKSLTSKPSRFPDNDPGSLRPPFDAQVSKGQPVKLTSSRGALLGDQKSMVWKLSRDCRWGSHLSLCSSLFNWEVSCGKT